MRGKMIYVLPADGRIRLYSAVEPLDEGAGKEKSETALLEIEDHGPFLKEQTVERIRQYYEGGGLKLPFETHDMDI